MGLTHAKFEATEWWAKWGPIHMGPRCVWFPWVYFQIHASDLSSGGPPGPHSPTKKRTHELGSKISFFILDSSPISGGFEWKRLLNDLIDSDT